MSSKADGDRTDGERSDDEEEKEEKKKSSKKYKEEWETVRINELDLNKIHPISVDDDKGGSKIVVIGKPGCFAPGTAVMMFNGQRKRVEDVSVGDILMGDDSTPRTVSELCSGIDTMYTVKVDSSVPIGDFSENKNTDRIFTGKKFGICPYTVNSKHILSLVDIKTGKKSDITVENYLKLSKDAIYDLHGYKNAVDYPNDDSVSLEFCKNQGQHINISQMIDEKIIFNSIEKRLAFLDGIIDKAGYRKTRRDYTENLIDIVINPVVVKTARPQYCRETAKKVVQLLNSMGITYVLSFGKKISIVYITIMEKQYLVCKERYRRGAREDDKKSFCKGFYLTYPIKLVKEDNRSPYFGFVLDGNNRFLLGDCTVVHNTGKSKLIHSIMYAKKHIIPIGQIYSGTEESSGSYGKICARICIYDGINELKMLDFEKRQKLARKHLRNPWALQVLDDCTDDPKLINRPTFQKYYKNGRWWNMLHILSLQFALDMKPAMRNCIDGTFILRESNPATRVKLWKNFVPCVRDYSQFEDLMDSLTDDYCSLYVDNRSTSNKIEDCIFYYKADLKRFPCIDTGDWKFGAKSYHDFSDERDIGT